MSTQAYPRSAEIRDALFPYGLFFFGIVLGLIPTLNYITVPIHELGHVLAAFFTGGYGAFRWDHALTYGGNAIAISYGGAVFHTAILTGIAIALLIHRKWLFVAGFSAGAAFYDTTIIVHSTDWVNWRGNYPFMDKIPYLMGALVVIAVAAAFIYSLVTLLTKLSNSH